MKKTPPDSFVISAEWFAIAEKLEAERKFRVDLTDLGFTINQQEFWMKDERYMWALKFNLMPIASQSIVVDKKLRCVISTHSEMQGMEFLNPVPFNEYVIVTKKYLREVLTKAIESLDKSTYTPQSILNNLNSNTTNEAS